MIWEIILTTILHTYSNTNGTGSIAADVTVVGGYADQKTCMFYANFLAKPVYGIGLDGTTQVVGKTSAVCLPRQVAK